MADIGGDAISNTLLFIRVYNRNRVSYVTKVESPSINTPNKRAHAHLEVDIYFSIHNGDQEIKFTLEPNHDILPHGAEVQYLDENGEVARREKIVRKDYLVYKGNTWTRDDMGWTHAGWARIVISRDGENPFFEGAFILNGDAHHVMSRANYMKTRHPLDPIIGSDDDEFMVVFRDSDIEKPSYQELKRRSELGLDTACSSDKLAFNNHPDHPVNQMILERTKLKRVVGSLGLDQMMGAGSGGFTKRQMDGDIIGNSGNSAGVNLRTSIGSTDGCPKTRQVALIGVATDCTYTGDFPSEADAKANVIRQLNTASDLYERRFNITLGLAQIIVSSASCPPQPPALTKWNVPCGGSATIESRLNLFSEWRGNRSDDKMALWTLLTTCETGSSVGLAWLGQLCKTQANTNALDGSFVSGVNVVARTSTEWKVLAHEIGHTMGAVHDCTSQSCGTNMPQTSQCCPLSATECDAGQKFIMNPSTSESIQDFSPCTVGNICSAIGRRGVDTSCLTSNRGVTIITEQECGNGIVEKGEDCDCGGVAQCAGNKCCDPKTCKFVDNAVCDDSNEDCCTSCQFASSSKVCRPSNGICDPEERCSGKTSTCPDDKVTPDGTVCSSPSSPGDLNLKCASGQCTSRDQQCKTVMGRLTSSNDTRSCDNSNCVLTCQSPEFGIDMCLRMQQNFLDGTPCKGDGVCMNGYCKGASTLGEVRSWIDRHRNIVIGVAAGVGALLLFSIISCCCSRYRGRRRRPKGVPSPPQRGVQQWQQLPPRPAPAYTRPFNNSAGHRGSESSAARGGYPGGQGGSGGYGGPPPQYPTQNGTVRYA
ncbi:Similar to Disintegrin and metalloproteinase domain-containing protein B; acc. no. Q4WQ08 [Pyronema omphalodes CBS 100304]|uniref:Disintegrin and metalloproteinase domain-containing protein B n=1 Tax=Pyronema omphalodes (strain CBS 100304) TaxID=1076935 RepID=U4LRY3_PYROM|nr:Similar to Disintegrin and metalloproteinase domain-containing protein B; acc. no. Q4WQ08 [Pyronema omphalodes CBS 100304]